MNRIFLALIVIVCIVGFTICSSQTTGLQTQFFNIKNDTFWNTVDGNPIYSQGGGVFQFKDPNSGELKYYWYGVHYREAELYRQDPSITQERNYFVSVTCYSSVDLVNWKFENDVLTRDELDRNFRRTGWVGRMGVAYVEDINQYALFIQHGDQVLVALSDSPVGDFKWHNRMDMTDRIGTPNTGDQTVFTDDDTGKSYLIYSYGSGRNKIYVSEIGIQEDGRVGLIDITQIFRGAGREGNCMFKYKGKYYMYASNLYGWNSSFAYYLVADDIRGPYLPENEMLVTPGCEEDFAHVTQTGFFIRVKGSKEETILYCGDRWANFAGNGLGYNQWFPMSFEGDKPYFNSLNSWNLNAETGEWTVAEDNNYVKNASFEADRRYIPNPVKPVQDSLTGWKTEFILGNIAAVDSEDSPVLNYFNSREDRLKVIGERGLNITDKIDFKRKISQQITSTPYVPLPDGNYTLQAKVKNSSGFSTLQLYAESNGKTKTKSFNNENSDWQTIEIKSIKVRKGRVEIGFIAAGKAGSRCQVDDVSLVKQAKR